MLVLLAVVLITVDYKTGRTERLTGVHGAAHSVLDPVESGVSAVVDPVGRFVTGIGDLHGSQRKADRLERQNEDLRRQLADQGEVRREAGQLDALRLVADRGQYTILPARVVATGDTTGSDWTVTIDAGSRDGLKPDELVLNAQGLVGSVITTTRSTAVVRLACDPGSHVGARLERTRLLGAVSGGVGTNQLNFVLYDTSKQIVPGERLVTYGSLDYAAGVPIGTVTRVTSAGSGLTRTAEVKPFVNFGALDTLAVIVGKPRTDPGDRVLPPGPVPTTKPAARPTATPSAGLGGTAGVGATGATGATTGVGATVGTPPVPPAAPAGPGQGAAAAAAAVEERPR